MEYDFLQGLHFVNITHHWHSMWWRHVCFIPLIESKNKDYGDLNLDIPLLRLYASVYFGVYFGCAFASCIREKRKLIKAGNRLQPAFTVAIYHLKGTNYHPSATFCNNGDH